MFVIVYLDIIIYEYMICALSYSRWYDRTEFSTIVCRVRLVRIRRYHHILSKSLMMGHAQFAWPTVFYWAGDNNSIPWGLSWFTGDRMKNWLAISCWVRPSRNWIFLHNNIQWNHDMSLTQNTPEMFKRFPDLPCDGGTVPSQLTSVYWSYMLGCPPNQQKWPTSLVGDFNKQ